MRGLSLKTVDEYNLPPLLLMMTMAAAFRVLLKRE